MRGNKPFYGFCGFMSEQDALFERLARERNITVEEMKEIISARILKGWNDTNPIKWNIPDRLRCKIMNLSR